MSGPFRTAVLALDPAVTEEFKKLYVAYKAETNFVDVIPQAKRLRLTLNLQFHELEDSRRVAKDVTGLGRWATVTSRVDLVAADELPYALGLGAAGVRERDGRSRVTILVFQVTSRDAWEATGSEKTEQWSQLAGHRGEAALCTCPVFS